MTVIFFSLYYASKGEIFNFREKERVKYRVISITWSNDIDNIMESLILFFDKILIEYQKMIQTTENLRP